MRLRPIGLSCAGAALVVTGQAAQQELFPHADLDALLGAAIAAPLLLALYWKRERLLRKSDDPEIQSGFKPNLDEI